MIRLPKTSVVVTTKERIAFGYSQTIPAGGTAAFLVNPSKPCRVKFINLYESEHCLNEDESIDIAETKIGNLYLPRWSKRVPITEPQMSISFLVMNHRSVEAYVTLEVVAEVVELVP